MCFLSVLRKITMHISNSVYAMTFRTMLKQNRHQQYSQAILIYQLNKHKNAPLRYPTNGDQVFTAVTVQEGDTHRLEKSKLPAVR